MGLNSLCVTLCAASRSASINLCPLAARQIQIAFNAHIFTSHFNIIPSCAFSPHPSRRPSLLFCHYFSPINSPCPPLPLSSLPVFASLESHPHSVCRPYLALSSSSLLSSYVFFFFPRVISLWPSLVCLFARLGFSLRKW